MEISKNKDDDEQEQSKSIDKDVSFDPHREFKIDKQLPGMGLIEEEKFQWMKEAPTPTWKGIKVSKIMSFLHCYIISSLVTATGWSVLSTVV